MHTPSEEIVHKTWQEALNPYKKRKSCFISVPVLLALKSQGKASSNNIKLSTQILQSKEEGGEVQGVIFAMYAEYQNRLYSIQPF